MKGESAAAKLSSGRQNRKDSTILLDITMGLKDYIYVLQQLN